MTSATCSRKAAQRLVILHRADEFLEVFQPARRFGGTVGLPHVGVAAFLEDLLGKLGVGLAVERGGPAVEQFHHLAQRVERTLGFSSSVSTSMREAASIGTRAARAAS